MDSRSEQQTLSGRGLTTSSTLLILPSINNFITKVPIPNIFLSTISCENLICSNSCRSLSPFCRQVCRYQILEASEVYVSHSKNINQLSPRLVWTWTHAMRAAEDLSNQVGEFLMLWETNFMSTSFLTSANRRRFFVTCLLPVSSFFFTGNIRLRRTMCKLVSKKYPSTNSEI